MPPVTGTMASEANGQWVKEQLDSYQDAHFLKPDGTLDMTTNTTRISLIMKNNGFVQDGKYRVYEDLHVFPTEYFCPKQTTGEFLLTENTYCDHHFMGTWNDGNVGWKSKVRKCIGQKNMTRLINLKRKIKG